jgi:hypothetical protein
MIYVDDMRDGWCHMVTDGDIEELHTFAQGIGLKRSWFQITNNPHYDLKGFAKREEAIKNGAKPVTSREMISILRSVRA